ncbi:putative transcription factor Hap3/NF-YB family [Helianthus annuus]|uniref:Putative histone-fold protein n=1 Tax=Helianthus annuus TaxID=4232 RepID=A0A251V135_HELAN|nr:nuclear transcription factor Y subunit B-1 [Helianthus annuus]KAF5811369.1 putative transcription factor Hap3/NF-YB family [Helianthus annuus]KAJ0932474.1 putative transcription factor Hap3/NF-YB family [Helianthus annuus]
MENAQGFHGPQGPPPQPTPGNNECIVREQDRLMPIANVIRIMRNILPRNAKISDDSKETVQECVSEFISFVTSEANDRCQREQRKTITAEDILWAMSKLGFEDYLEPLTLYLHRYRETDGGERGPMRAAEPQARPVGMGDGYHMSHHHLFGPAGLMNGESSNAAGPSGPVAGFKPYAQCKE